MYVTVRASQVVVGLVFNVLAIGIASTVYRRALGESAAPESIAMFPAVAYSVVERSAFAWAGFVWPGDSALFDAGAGSLAHLVLFRTKFGLALRASGENPGAADSAGISVARMRYAGR